jgi:uncharacterized membrane protein (DUF485 family)
MEAQATQPPSVSRIATKYGLIQGVLGFLLFLVVAMTGMRQNWLTTSISIIVLVVLIVLAHREYKKTHEGIMTYGQGVGLGTLLSVIASVLSCILLYIYVSFINTGYAAAALKVQRAAMEERGMTGAQLEQAMSMTSVMLTPIGIVITALISGVILGFIVALVVSAFTKCNDPRAVI